MADDVTVAVEDYVATVEFHRPPNNFFDVPLIQALVKAVFALDEDPDCRAIVLCSEGKNFCAGADLGPQSDLVDKTANLYEQAVALFSARKPIVAAVQGAAVGGGLGLALAADFRVATPDTRFSCNFAKLGFHQGFGVSVTLPAVVGQQRALELMYTGGQAKGAEALAIGLCDRLSPATRTCATRRTQFASEIAASGPLAVLAIRETMRGELADRVRAGDRREHEQQQILRAHVRLPGRRRGDGRAPPAALHRAARAVSGDHARAGRHRPRRARAMVRGATCRSSARRSPPNRSWAAAPTSPSGSPMPTGATASSAARRSTACSPPRTTSAASTASSTRSDPPTCPYRKHWGTASTRPSPVRPST